MIKAEMQRMISILKILACPICKTELVYNDVDSVRCTNNSKHVYRKNQWGFFEFSSEKILDKYDNDALVRQYIGYSYGCRLINVANGERFVGTGQSEGLYRCVSQIALQEILSRRLFDVTDVCCLDMACGVGRCVADLATNLPKATIVGFDYSTLMIKYAKEILLAEGELAIDLREFGFGFPSMKRYHLENVFLAQADATALPIRDLQFSSPKFVGFHMVLNQMLIDRIEVSNGVAKSLEQSLSVLRKNGVLIFTCPYNWILKESWNEYGKDRFHILDYFKQNGLIIEEAFDGLVYRELIDPHGTHLELPVMVIKGRKSV